MTIATGSYIIATRRVVPAKLARGCTPGLPETSIASISANPVQHRSESLARTEAERLARQEPGTEYIVLEVKGTVMSNATVWK